MYSFWAMQSITGRKAWRREQEADCSHGNIHSQEAEKEQEATSGYKASIPIPSDILSQVRPLLLKVSPPYQSYHYHRNKCSDTSRLGTFHNRLAATSKRWVRWWVNRHQIILWFCFLVNFEWNRSEYICFSHVSVTECLVEPTYGKKDIFWCMISEVCRPSRWSPW